MASAPGLWRREQTRKWCSCIFYCQFKLDYRGEFFTFFNAAGTLNAPKRGDIINCVGLFQAGRRLSNKIKKGGNA